MGLVSRQGMVCLRAGVILVAVAILASGIGYARKKAPPRTPATLPEKINALAKQLPGVMLVDADPILGQIQTLVVDHLKEWMADRTPTDIDVRRELENVFSLLHYPLVGQPATFAFPWNGQMVIGAGYTFGWTDFDRQNVVAVFTSLNGKSQLAAVTNFVPRTDLHFESLPQMGWSDLRFFIYGSRLGKSQERLSIILYAFDGQKLKPLWEKQDIYDGEMSIEKDKVLIKYLKEDEYIDAVQRSHHPPRHLATYQITASGLQLLDEHDIPF